MAAEYYILLKDPYGTPLAHIDNFYELNYSKARWEPGLLTFKMDGNDSKIPLFADNCQVEVYRRNAGLGFDWYCDFYGLFRSQTRETSADGRDYFTATCPGQATILSWPRVLWADKTTNRSIFTSTAAETIMKTLVQYNCTSSATTGNGRLLSWPSATIQQTVTIEPDQARGNLVDWKCAYKNLLTELQAVALAGNVDFDLINTGGAAWIFRVYLGQRGSDKSASVIFDTNYGNMAEPKYRLDKVNEATIAIVGGRGVEASRHTVQVTGKNYSAVSNYIETFVHATESDTDAYLSAKGSEELYRVQSRNNLSFRVLQTPACVYGRDYFLGDLVGTNYKIVTGLKQVVHSVQVAFKPTGSGENPEQISIEMRDP